MSKAPINFVSNASQLGAETKKVDNVVKYFGEALKNATLLVAEFKSVCDDAKTYGKKCADESLLEVAKCFKHHPGEKLSEEEYEKRISELETGAKKKGAKADDKSKKTE